MWPLLHALATVKKEMSRAHASDENGETVHMRNGTVCQYGMEHLNDSIGERWKRILEDEGSEGVEAIASLFTSMGHYFIVFRRCPSLRRPASRHRYFFKDVEDSSYFIAVAGGSNPYECIENEKAVVESILNPQTEWLDYDSMIDSFYNWRVEAR